MELKPLYLLLYVVLKRSINRTFMELKLVLYVILALTLIGINRTFMELKHNRN